jgi:hypothetical protein
MVSLTSVTMSDIQSRAKNVNEILNTSALVETRISNSQAADIGLLTKVTVVSQSISIYHC